MFKEHQTKIGKWARASPDNFGKLLQFVVLTVRTPLHRVKADIETAEQGGPDAMGVLFGFKFRAYREAWEGREKALSYLEHVWADPEQNARGKELAMLEYVADLYGFGPVKAGFVLQLAYGISGCIDTHNLKRFGYSMRTFSNYCQRKTRKARLAFLRRYCDAIARQGGTEYLWNSWCAFVANNSPGPYQGSAYEVSRAHCAALGIE